MLGWWLVACDAVWLPVDDTGANDQNDTAEVDDTSDPPPGGPLACYLGPDRDGAACLPTVAFDAAAFGGDYDYPPPLDGSDQYAAPTHYLDLAALAPAFEVAPNFVADEFLSAEKGRYGVLQAHLVERLQDLRDDLGAPLIVTSGYRNPAWNAGVGGVEFSRHQYGDAADLDATGLSVEELGDRCDAHGASYVGLYEDGHTHCDWRDDPLDSAFYGNSRHARPVSRAAMSARLMVDAAGVWSAPAEGFDEGEPLRRWTAVDADGRRLIRTYGRVFVAPPGTARVEVTIGGLLTRSSEI